VSRKEKSKLTHYRRIAGFDKRAAKAYKGRRRTKSESVPPLPRLQYAMRSSTASLRLHVESALAGRVAAPFRLREAKLPPVVPTGITALDELVGGLPRGSLTEIYGPPCSGKTSILHATLASRTLSAEACALVDAQDAFDPCGSQASGVVLPRLLWVRCHELDKAFRSLDLLLHGGGFGFIALDLSDAPARLVRQVPLNVWFRLRRAVEDTATVLLVLAQESNAKTCASLVLRMEKEVARWSLRTRQTGSAAGFHTPGCLLDGSACSAEVVRSLLRHKQPRFIDQPKALDGATEEVARFEVSAERYVMEERKQKPG
jgi:recombination protein RecA